MKKLQLAFLFASILTLTLLLTGCSKDTALTVYAEGDFIKQDCLDSFTEKTGIKVNYLTGTRTPAENQDQDAVSSDSSALLESEEAPIHLLAELQEWKTENKAALAKSSESKGVPCTYDVVLTDQDTLTQLRDANCLLKLDQNAIPNMKLINETYLPSDAKDCYGIPVLWGTAGIIWNTQLFSSQVNSWKALWNSAYRKKILMPSTARDCASVALAVRGKQVNTSDKASIQGAYKSLQKQTPLVAGYLDGTTYTMMTNNTVTLAATYSGAAIAMMSDNPNLAFSIPDEGSWRISYSYGITAGSEWPDASEKFLNYMCSANCMAQNAVYSKYSTTSDQALEKMDKAWHKNPLAYPDNSILKQAPLLTELDRDTEQLHTQLFQKLTGQTNKT